MSTSSTAKVQPTSALDGASKRAAVHRVLREQLPEEDAAHALLLWDQHAAGAGSDAASPINALMAFVSALSRRFALSTSALRRSLFYALSPEEPHAAVAPVSADTPVPEGLSEEDAVVNALLTKVRELAGRAGDGRDSVFTQSLKQRLARIGLSPPSVEAVQAWCTDGSSPIQGLSRQEMERLVYSAYVACGEACGPVSADRAFAEAIREVEKLPQAAVLSPRALL